MSGEQHNRGRKRSAQPAEPPIIIQTLGYTLVIIPLMIASHAGFHVDALTAIVSAFGAKFALIPLLCRVVYGNWFGVSP